MGEWGVDGPRLDIGGTFAIFYFYTIASVIGRVSVSTSNASKNACGFNSFPAGTVAGQGADGPTNLHQLKVEPLLPGTTYNYIIEMFDLAGNRIVKDGSFSTLRRNRKISSIFIEDDGDNTGTGQVPISASRSSSHFNPPLIKSRRLILHPFRITTTILIRVNSSSISPA